MLASRINNQKRYTGYRLLLVSNEPVHMHVDAAFMTGAGGSLVISSEDEERGGDIVQ